MRLKSGHLYWPSTYRPSALGQRLRSDIRCDVLVVGSGISGAMTAERLSGAGIRVVVVDRRPIASGSTPATTALVLYEIDVPLIELRKRPGEQRAGIAYSASHDAVDELRRTVGRLNDHCDLQQRPSLYLASTKKDVDKLLREASARQRLGIDARFLSGPELEAGYRFQRPAAILSQRAFEVNPVRLTHALLGAAVQGGATIFPNLEVDAWDCARTIGPHRITAGGHTITADWVVVACGYEAPEQFAPVARLTRLRSTYAIATSRLEEEPWPRSVMLWEMAEPYLYARTTPDRRVIIGGLDEKTSDPSRRDRLIPAKRRKLAAALRKLVPRLRFRVEYSWAGTFAETADGLPYIGAHPKWPRILFALGYGGNGLTFSVIAADIITAAVLGASSDIGDVFGFKRSSVG